ncbi:MAG: hypothetical protein IJN91_02970, partial [Alphaproteobacteria bacterium]|nr:hypothetical protein [Alphaproteobacteria bacterium]
RLVVCTAAQPDYLIIPVSQLIGNNPDHNTSFCVKTQKEHRRFCLLPPPVFLLTVFIKKPTVIVGNVLN